MLVHNKGKYVRHAAGVMLVPGTNDVSEKEFNKFSKHPIMKKLIESEEIVSLEKTEGGGRAETTKDLNASEAIELVKDTYDPSLLEEWKETEDRTTVVAAIDEQLETLQGEDDGDSDGDE